MSDLLHGFVQQDNISRASDGAPAGMRLTRDGAVVGIPWVQALCLEGRVFGVQGATTDLAITAGHAFGDGILDMDEFDYLHTVPPVVAVLPVYYGVAYSAVGTVDESGLVFGWGSGGVEGGSGVTLNPFNLKTGSSNTSSCTVVAFDDGGGTAVTLAGIISCNITFALTGAAASAQQFVPSWSVATASYVPVIEGKTGTGRQIAAWHAGQAGVGYITSTWVELPINAVN